MSPVLAGLWRGASEGQGWQTHGGRGTLGPPYFEVPDMRRSLEQVTQLGGSIVHHGDPICICRDSEESPFGLMQGGGHEGHKPPPQPSEGTWARVCPTRWGGARRASAGRVRTSLLAPSPESRNQLRELRQAAC
ncbi:MAG: hypothetical protein JO352_09580 [Chloroflexi bacterium]|nr:hypothetical protein [Chloroflexota bacterium]